MRGCISSIGIDVDVDEVFAGVSDEDLLAEIQDRKPSGGMILGIEGSVAEAVLADLWQGGFSDATTLLERTLRAAQLATVASRIASQSPNLLSASGSRSEHEPSSNLRKNTHGPSLNGGTTGICDRARESPALPPVPPHRS